MILQEFRKGVSLIIDAVLRRHPELPVPHLGDALDVSCTSEADRFFKLWDKDRQWVVAPGNHDGYFMGNFSPSNPGPKLGTITQTSWRILRKCILNRFRSLNGRILIRQLGCLIHVSQWRNMKTVISDRPILKLEEDYLGRYPFAKAIADQIIHTPDKGSLRIGIYGGWGEGKTSILRLIANELEKDGHVCVWITPWVFSNKDDILSYIISEITEKLEIDIKDLSIAKKGAQIIKDLRSASGTDIKLKLADTIFGAALEKFIGEKSSEKGQFVIATIDKRLNDRKLIIFVDDLDRVRPELVPDLLLTLREALDYPNYFYIMALAPDVVEEGLRKVHQGWGEPGQFLEKIIELPKYVPPPTPHERSTYAKELIKTFESKVDLAALQDIAPFLNENPRKLKLYLRYIASLYGVFSRFHSNEVDWRTLYLCLLLRFEFPHEIRSLIEDQTTLEDIELSSVRAAAKRSKSSDETDSVVEKPESRYAPLNRLFRERFLLLCNAIRERGYLFKGKYRLPKLITLSDMPPVLTYKELEEMLEALEKDGLANFKKGITEKLKPYGGLNSKTGQALVEGIIDTRQNLLSYLIDRDIESELKEGLNTVKFLTECLKIISIELKGFKNNILPVDCWFSIFKHFSSWAHFKTFEYYETLRKQERKILSEIVKDMPMEMQFKILESRVLNTDFDVDNKSNEFDKLIKEIYCIIESATTASFLNAFESPEGIESFWSIDYHSYGKSFLFSKRSVFHSAPLYRTKLKKISKKAGENIEIQKNFITYFRMLNHGGYGSGGTFSQKDCQALLQDHELLELIWSACVIKPLNPRAAGGLHRYRVNLLSQGIPEEVLKTPKWWDRLSEIGFFQKIE